MLPVPLRRLRHDGGLHEERLAHALRQTGDENVFNPSHLVVGASAFLAYRAYGPGQSRPFHAYCLVGPSHGAGPWERHDLTAHARQHGVTVVADPKLVVVSDQPHVTFNTGYSASQNELYLMRLAPEPGPPQRCTVPGRQPVEKNWGFFESDGELRALYALRPLTVLALTRGELGGSGSLAFSPTSGELHAIGTRPGLSIGSQPVRVGENLLLMGHDRVYVRGKRGYFGRPVTIRGVDGSRPQLAVGSSRWIHSLRGLRPSTPRHNPNLLFATYFSGLTLDGAHASVGYGVNDVDFGFARVATESAWR